MLRLIRFTSVLSTLVILLGLPGPLAGQGRKGGSALVISVTPRGIFPSEVVLPPGPVSVIFLERTGSRSTEFRINAVSDSRLLASARVDLVERKLHRTAASVTLTRGEYTVTIPTRPRVSCKITVKP